MTPSHPHGVFLPTYIDSQPLPQVSKDLLPWLVKDRREAEEGSTFYNSATKTHDHDRAGLRYAERELRRIEAEIEGLKHFPGSDRAVILLHQARGMEERVEFWRGKCHLLDRVIAETRARS